MCKEASREAYVSSELHYDLLFERFEFVGLVEISAIYTTLSWRIFRRPQITTTKSRLVTDGREKIGTFRSDYDYEYDFWAREAWVLAGVDTVVAVVSSQQKYFSNLCEYEVITFCQSRECWVDKHHKMPQSRQNIARQVARNISQCIRAFKD